MAVTVTSSSDTDSGIDADGSLAISIDSDAEAIIVTVTGYAGANGDDVPLFNVLNWDNGGTMDFTHIASEGWNATEYTQVSAWIMTDASGDWPGTGSKTLYYESVNTYAEAFSLGVFGIKGLDTSDPIGDTDKAHGGTSWPWTSSMTGAVAGDLGFVAIYQNYGTITAYGNGQTTQHHIDATNRKNMVEYEDGENAMGATSSGSKVAVTWIVNQAAAGTYPYQIHKRKKGGMNVLLTM